MKALNAGVIATLTVALSTLVCSPAAAQCPTPPADPTTPQIHNINVNLANGATPGSCVASNIKPGQPGYKIRTSNQEDIVNWNITNNCSHAVKLGISNFRALVPPMAAGALIDQPLTVAPSSLFVDVAKRGGVGVITAHINPGLNHYGRPCTQYEYDFEEITPTTRIKIADPQIEIPN